MSATPHLIESEPPHLHALYRKLILSDVATQLPGNPIKGTKLPASLSDDEIRQLVGYASLLSLSPNDAVEKPDSEDLFQRWVDFFQTRSLFSFSASCFYNIFSLQT
ncbi:MAG: hypothetical protein PHU06_01765, partial [Gallionella sp.]|nr:hypothetical protein [Gallionella sp.]MDD4958814.1 hypothetical protein [Gallionella sp.]